MIVYDTGMSENHPFVTAAPPRSGSCMHCASNEHVYQFNLGNFQARLCDFCLAGLIGSLPPNRRVNNQAHNFSLGVLERKISELETIIRDSNEQIRKHLNSKRS